MVLENLGSSLKDTIQKAIRYAVLDKNQINEIVKDIQRALISADVDIKLVFELTNRIKKKLLEEDVPKGLSKREYLVKLLYTELANLLGDEGHKIKIEKKPFKIMLIGLYGSGKTTTCSKLAKFFTKRGYKVCMAGTDTWRPAAQEQIEQLGKAIKVDTFIDKTAKKPVDVIKKHKKAIEKYDVIIIDTAGRNALDKQLEKELKEVDKEIKSNERILVLSGDIGQNAKIQAENFHKAVGVTGVILTKMDTTAKGGGALSACAITKTPVKFIGVGEKSEALEEFEPKRFVSRMLGMGDMETLLEKVKEATEGDEKKLEELGRKMLNGKFSLLDLNEQLKAMNKMGPLSGIMNLIPGIGGMKIPKDALNMQEGELKKFNYIMNSMTLEELEEPDVLTKTRIERIAKGSGTSVAEVRELIKKYRQMKKVMKTMSGGNLKRMMKKMGIKNMKQFENMM
ncbi:MAG: signal recognition particle receptor subunit alpha [Candidatus Nanoarchaeia archaeon]|nr:signal recognition particle receptor subunit alpha [Candidatus Nanoarchaeia archaeon]